MYISMDCPVVEARVLTSKSRGSSTVLYGTGTVPYRSVALPYGISRQPASLLFALLGDHVMDQACRVRYRTCPCAYTYVLFFYFILFYFILFLL